MGLPTISVSGQEFLRSDLAAFVGAQGAVDTAQGNKLQALADY